MKALIHAVIAVGIPVVLLSSGHAADLVCNCTVQASPETTGKIFSIGGEVLSSYRQGLQTVKNGSQIGVGSHIITGIDSTARIDIATCQLTVRERSEVMISRFGPKICVQVSEATNPFPQALSSAGASGATAIAGGLLVGGGTAIGGLILGLGGGPVADGGGGPMGGGGGPISR